MKAIVLSLLPLLLLACRKESEPLPPVTEGRLVSVTLTAAPTQTRSDLVDEDAADSGRDIRVAVYTDGRRVTDGSAPLGLRLMAGRRYNFYAWTGSSLPLGEVPTNESDLEGWEAVYPGWETAGDGQSALEDLLGTYGMPMAGSCLDCTPEALALDQTITVPLQRLFARIRLQVTYDETMTRLLPERTVGTVRVHNWAWACQPFGTGFDREKVRRGSLDVASAPDADGCYTLYLPENLQGELSEGDPDRCSFLSVELSLGDGYGLGGGVGDVCYRFYPGADAGDGYNIRRNRQYNVTLTLSYNGRFIEMELSRFWYELPSGPIIVGGGFNESDRQYEPRVIGIHTRFGKTDIAIGMKEIEIKTEKRIPPNQTFIYQKQYYRSKNSSSEVHLKF